MTIHLPEDVEISIRAEVTSGRFASTDEAIAAAWRAFQQNEPASDEAASDHQGASKRRKPIWERAEEIRRGVPDEEWAKLPTDGAEQLDHYIYGSARRPTA
jgi:Arc/MetJ-type ribon-helix-helix transcriptional regulator